jgi:hypothetical protein
VSAPAAVVAAWRASVVLQTEYPTLLSEEWSDAPDGGETKVGPIVIKSDREGLTFTHEKHGHVKTIPSK